jgi:hypothetical protein
MSRKKVEMKMSEAMELQAELTDLLKRKSSMKLKLELTEIQLKLKARTEPAAGLLQQIFDQHGEDIEQNGQRQKMIRRYVNGPGSEETEHFKDFTTINEQIVDFECPPITIELLEKVESDASYPSLIKLIIDNDLKA